MDDIKKYQKIARVSFIVALGIGAIFFILYKTRFSNITTFGFFLSYGIHVYATGIKDYYQANKLKDEAKKSRRTPKLIIWTEICLGAFMVAVGILGVIASTLIAFQLI